MDANQLNLIDVAWTTGYVVGQLPSQFILTKVRPSIWIPSCELVWTLLTFCLAAATSSNQVVAIRFVVGLVESVFYPAAHFLIGSWYLPAELGKRACIFHASSAAAGMFSGYLQAAVYTGLNGALGKAGWQWLFIMDGLISAPICLAGFFLIPDLPENTRAFYLTREDAQLAKQRMRDVGRAPRKALGWSIWRRVFTRWHVYALTVLYVVFINTGPSSSVSPLALWLKAAGWPVSQIASGRSTPTREGRSANKRQNIIPTGQSAVQLVATVSLAILSDLLRKRATVMSISTVSRIHASWDFCQALSDNGLSAPWEHLMPSIHWSSLPLTNFPSSLVSSPLSPWPYGLSRPGSSGSRSSLGAPLYLTVHWPWPGQMRSVVRMPKSGPWSWE